MQTCCTRHTLVMRLMSTLAAVSCVQTKRQHAAAARCCSTLLPSFSSSLAHVLHNSKSTVSFHKACFLFWRASSVQNTQTLHVGTVQGFCLVLLMRVGAIPDWIDNADKASNGFNKQPCIGSRWHGPVCSVLNEVLLHTCPVVPMWHTHQTDMHGTTYFMYSTNDLVLLQCCKHQTCACSPSGAECMLLQPPCGIEYIPPVTCMEHASAT